MPEILLTGGTGQVGGALLALPWPADVRLVAPARAALDLADSAAIERFLDGRSPAAILSCGAYTAVDAAEREPAAAFAVNALAPAVLAERARALDIPIVHVSTDYVFDGAKAGPYEVDDAVAPLGVYGASKAAGELAVRSVAPRHAIVRTSWVVGARGANFVKTMLRLGAERTVLRVVDDQHGAPTSADDLAAALQVMVLRMIADRAAPTGTFHFANAGETTWCGLARAVFETAAAHGGPAPSVEAISTADYPTPARRPANSRLSAARIAAEYGISPAPWRAAVDRIVGALVPANRPGSAA